jgi:excisionase family DNA binding protein
LTLSVHEAAALTGLTVTLLTEAMACGLLRSAKIGKRRVIRRDALDRFIARGERQPLRVRDAYRRERVLVAVAKP